MQPKPGESICGPACGTWGFLLAAYDYIAAHNKLDKGQKQRLNLDALHGWEIVDNTARLCAMNLLLHGIGGDECPILVDDALRGDPGQRFNLVLTNPPFGRKSSVTVVNEEGRPWTEKLWIYAFRTNQHITLKTNLLKREDLDDFVACVQPISDACVSR